MKRLISTALSCALVFTGMGMAAPAFAQAPSMPTIWSSSQSDTARTEQVQHRRHYRGHRGHYRGRYHGPRRYYGYRRHNNGAAVAAGVLGLAAGAAIAAGANRGYSDSHSYCASRFRSYDPRSGTYLGYDGYRHACP